jgi:hypothetical protein
MRAKSWALLAGFVVAVTLGRAPAAKAADDDHETTASYIAICSASLHSCQESIGMGVVFGLSGQCVPDSMELPSDAQIRQVIDWLKAHPNVHPEDWEPAVDAAITALYPCAK